SSHSSNQAPNNLPPTKRSRQNDSNNTVTQIDYSLTIPSPTALTTQSQQNCPSLPSTLDEIRAIINYISTPEPIVLLATSQQEVETAIAFLHTHFTFRGVYLHIINISELP
ncbi:9247_t:CDS:2, partial [Dentiscutata erythropus]